MPRLTLVSDGKPRRRLRIGLKGVFVVVIAVVHSAPAFLKTEMPIRQDLAAKVRTPREVSLAREVQRYLARSWTDSAAAPR
jgi:hypothetical protein